jgi:hypothetical protein
MRSLHPLADPCNKVPSIDNNQPTTLGPFGVVYFDDAFAGTVKKAQLDGGSATLITMVQNGVVLASPKELGAGALKATHQPSVGPVG